MLWTLAAKTMMAGYRVAIIKHGSSWLDNYLGCGFEYRDSGEAEWVVQGVRHSREEI